MFESFIDYFFLRLLRPNPELLIVQVFFFFVLSFFFRSYRSSRLSELVKM